MHGSHTRAVHRCAIVSTTLVLLTACGDSEEPIRAADAVAHYDEVAAAIAATAAPDAAWTFADSTRHVAADGSGTCLYTPGDWSMDSPLISADARSWDDVLDALGPSLEEYGFEPVDSTTEQQSRRVLETTDEHGATLQITEDGKLRIHSALVDADTCTAATLGLS